MGSIFDLLPTTNRANNPIELLKQFEQFKRQMVGKNPQAMVQELMQSGRMSKEQYQQLSQMAKNLQGILK